MITDQKIHSIRAAASFMGQVEVMIICERAFGNEVDLTEWYLEYQERPACVIASTLSRDDARQKLVDIADALVE